MTEENTDQKPVETVAEATANVAEATLNVDEAALNEEASRELEAMVAEVEAATVGSASDDDEDVELSAPQSQAERAAVIEALIFVADEPLSSKTIADVLKEDKEVINEALATLVEEFNSRHSGLQLR